MTYEDNSNLRSDTAFQSRVTACCATEGVQLPEAIMTQIIWPVACAPGFGEAFAAGGQGSITDPQILSAVQPALAALPPPA
jgi:hypothetical protein